MHSLHNIINWVFFSTSNEMFLVTFTICKITFLSDIYSFLKIIISRSSRDRSLFERYRELKFFALHLFLVVRLVSWKSFSGHKTMLQDAVTRLKTFVKIQRETDLVVRRNSKLQMTKIKVKWKILSARGLLRFLFS